MKASLIALLTIGLSHLPGLGADLRETQFPARLPKTINVAGAHYRSDTCLKPWIAVDPSDYAGRYVSRSITDGNAQLDLGMYREKSSDDTARWFVKGKLRTHFVAGPEHVVTFKHSEVQEPRQPTFDVLDRLTPALFVIFVDPESPDKRPKHGVVIGESVYVLEKELARGS